MSQLGYHPNTSSFNKALTSSMEDWKHRGTEITEFQTMSFFSAPSVALCFNSQKHGQAYQAGYL
jgi:hypothetical protein